MDSEKYSDSRIAGPCRGFLATDETSRGRASARGAALAQSGLDGASSANDLPGIGRGAGSEPGRLQHAGGSVVQSMGRVGGPGVLGMDEL